MADSIGLTHLLGTPEQFRKAKVEGFEHSVLKRMLKHFRVVPKGIDRLCDDAGGKLTTAWWHSRFRQWPVELHCTRIESYSVQDLFERPTKSPVYAEFVSVFPKAREYPSALFFKAQGFSTLVLTNVRWVLDNAQCYLRFSVKGGALYVTTFDEFIGSVPESTIELVAAEGF